MGRFSTKENDEVEARLVALIFSGFEDKLGFNLCRHYRSFVGRDYKVLVQVALFVLGSQARRLYGSHSQNVCYIC